MTITLNLPQNVDVSIPLQNALNQNAGDRIILPSGQYIASNVTLPGYTVLEGDGWFNTIINGQHANKDTFIVGGDYAKLSNIQIQGPKGKSTSNTLTLVNGAVGITIRDVVSFYGQSALAAWAVDCTLDNCFFADSYGLAAVVSQGANWYRRCKIDTNSTDEAGVPQYAFYHGSPPPSDSTPIENHFVDCDFSGDYQFSVGIYDPVARSVLTMHSCVLSQGIIVSCGLESTIVGSTIGKTITSAAPMILEGCASFEPIIATGAVQANNCIGITIG